MSRFYSKPCRLGEKITVFYTVNDSPFSYVSSIPIAIEARGLENLDIDCWIDTSGSMDDESPKVIQSIRSVLPRANILYESDENWLGWFISSLQNLENGKAIFLFINESDSNSIESLLNQLGSFDQAWRNSLYPTFGQLFIISNNEGSPNLVNQAEIIFSRPQMEQTNYTYSVIKNNYGLKVKIALQKILSTEGKRYLRIFTPPSFNIQKALEFIESISPDSASVNNLLPDSFFSKKVVDVKSNLPIEFRLSCEERCPPGYCEIQISDYPGYCCIKA